MYGIWHLKAGTPLTTTIALVYEIASGLGGGFGPQAFFQLWSAEAFPTTIRSTTLAWLLASFLVISGVLGLIFAPQRPGTPLTT